VLLDAPSEETFGFELAQVSGLPSGTIYPILHRLEQGGWISGRWQDADNSVDDLPRRRRYYRLTGAGRREAQRATAGQSGALRQLVPGWSI
jgi:DNA-binding PadR family transcriptional regulator